MSTKFNPHKISNTIVRSLEEGKIYRDWSGQTIGWTTIVMPLGFNVKNYTVYLCKDLFGDEVMISAKEFTRPYSKYSVWTKEASKKLQHLSRCYFNMLERCFNPNSASSKNYHFKGVRVCKEWLGPKGKINFIEWAVATGYEFGLTIDRTGKHYSPENCRWVTKAYNCSHTSRTKLNERIAQTIREEYTRHEGSLKSFAETAAKKYNVGITAITNIVYRNSWN